jgi:hypothetical protein
MIHRIGKHKYRIFALDIETHNDEESIAKQETSMWLGCFIDETSKMRDKDAYFYNMDELLTRLEGMSSARQKHGKTKPITNIAIYIYNLSFEWSFLLPYVLKWGFEYKSEIEDNDEMVFNTVSTKSVSSVWQAILKFHKDSGYIRFVDLSKIFGGGLGAVAKAFNLPTQKGSIDYRLNRLHGHKITVAEKNYCFRDTRIIIDILEELIRRGDNDFFNVISMASYSMKKLLKAGWPRALKPYVEFRKEYPELSEEETAFLRHSVSGGICYAPPRYQFKDIKSKIIHIDAHSMHPSSAYRFNYPYDKGEYHVGKPKGTDVYERICCCHVLVSYNDTRLHSVIKLIGQDFTDEAELWLWDFEIETMKKCYVNFEIQYIDYYAYKFKPLKWRRYFRECYIKRKEAKANKDYFNVLYYKLLMNSSYGKLLENPHDFYFKNIIDEDGIIDSEILPKEDTEINARYTYIPVGSCIPAHSRCELIELALKIGWEYVVYFDTDSIFFIDTPETRANMEKYMDNRDFLGGWDIEEIIDRAMFTAPKRYKVEVDGKSKFKMGGFNLDKYASDNGYDSTHDIPFDEVNIITSKWKVQRAYRVKGGTLIDFQVKEVKVPKKYVDIYERNVLK